MNHYRLESIFWERVLVFLVVEACSLESELGMLGIRVENACNQSWDAWNQSWECLDSEFGMLGIRVRMLGIRVGNAWNQS